MINDYRPFFFLVSFVFLGLGFIINGLGSVELPAMEATPTQSEDDKAPPLAKIIAVILYAIAVAVCLVGLYL